ncbi:major facilitator superfamily domain-containing protein [Aspergillus carlsbadensis]|nr:major facilitator superfamily domain-containing protein [Aspergillus carlsbadensis]
MIPNRVNAAVSTTNTYMNPASTAQVVDPSQFSWKFHVVAAGTYFVFNTSLGTSLPSGAKDKLAMAFQFSTDDMRLVLPTSLYMAGFALGPLAFGPLSEYFGRKPILLVTCAIYLIFTMGCALAPSFPALLVFRLIAGVGGAAPNAVLGGLYTDIYANPHHRGMAMSWFIFTAIIPSLLGPAISGFVATASWRWPFWTGLITGGPALPLLLTMPETYYPVLARTHNNSLMPGGSKPRLLQLADMVQFLQRPFVLLMKEPIVLFCSVYLAMTYSLLFLYFQGYFVVFQGNMCNIKPPCHPFLTICLVLLGSVIALLLFSLYSTYHSNALKAGLDWATVEEYRRLPIACIGAPILPVSLFWFGWSSNPEIHAVVPMMSGIFFGIGYLLIFMSLLNYLTDAYPHWSASAASAASTSRALFAVALPLATTPMYANLGISWTNSLLGFISIALGVVPFVLIRYGAQIRRRSKRAHTDATNLSLE